jgi:hypothetical protein
LCRCYGKRWFVDNQERFRGHVSKLMDAQRIYNAKVSKLSETDSLAPREKPIFLAEQMPPNLADLWAAGAGAPPLRAGQSGHRRRRQICGDGADRQDRAAAASAGHRRIAADRSRRPSGETDDGSDEVKANTSAEAMDIAATRIDAKSGLYLDNMRQSVQREGEIYLSMAKECYFEPGRKVETMTEDGTTARLSFTRSFTDKQGVHRSATTSARVATRSLPM